MSFLKHALLIFINRCRETSASACAGMDIDQPAQDSATLFVNPGLACKGSSGGSFADITILAGSSSSASIAQRCAVQLVHWSRTKQ